MTSSGSGAIPSAAITSRPASDYSACVLRVRVGTGMVLACLAAIVLPGGASAASGSLYTGLGPRPGPDILYRAPAQAPQLSNSGIWSAKPILVSGSSAYRD